MVPDTLAKFAVREKSGSGVTGQKAVKMGRNVENRVNLMLK